MVYPAAQVTSSSRHISQETSKWELRRAQLCDCVCAAERFHMVPQAPTVAGVTLNMCNDA